jgi:hypothetical protein
MVRFLELFHKRVNACAYSQWEAKRQPPNHVNAPELAAHQYGFAQQQGDLAS